jgi:S-adenosylmethionine:tRNA ribosyltransferase-isomerase
MTPAVGAGPLPLRFDLPADRSATEPPEATGRRRDDVRLLASWRGTGDLVSSRFRDLPDLLAPGDVVVVNTSGTLPAAVPAERPGGERLELHVSTRLPGAPPVSPGAEPWVVELRTPLAGGSSAPHRAATPGEVLVLPGGATAEVIAPWPPSAPAPTGSRLWLVVLRTPLPVPAWLEDHGRPIRYSYVGRDWPLSAYQTVFALEPGSAEMPSAARPFTPEVVTRLVARGIDVAPLVLHCGVASLEEGEAPYAEQYRVPPDTARRIELARRSGGRVVAVGTTVVRALETVVDDRGQVHPGAGWTELVVTPERGVRAVDGLVTGWHEPAASHLLLLEAVAGRPLLEASYAAALAEGYRWHEFGDSHLVLP